MAETETRAETVLRYGLVGAGTMGQEHIRYIELIDGGEIVAIADPHVQTTSTVHDVRE
ncbi:hypothetical protein [Microbacterium suwonense]|uniref:Gfo/Idh/MocA family oxidoreductase n=1 Tax=Microbacterium suwonense TaxID=683047 RepID=A0ABM8FWM6_9MICO|nr:hypothetical protein [Microbacterium suwonense]BDZ40128.1 hypothetical protein GCM10025863_27420 [Microbacterium suwonense]